ncbi:hypothetical protein Tco_0164493 [Tanacetum coccineum]
MDDKETAKLQMLVEIIPDEEKVAVDAIPLAKKIRPEDLETLWRLVKAKHGETRPLEGYERVLWDDLKVMFEPHVEDAVWRELREGKGRIVGIQRLLDAVEVAAAQAQAQSLYCLSLKLILSKLELMLLSQTVRALYYIACVFASVIARVALESAVKAPHKSEQDLI